MATTRLGVSDLEITPIGLGSWAIGGGGNPYGWGPQSDEDSIAAIRCALDLGVNWIDTAAGYGRGHSEEVVGRAIAGRRHDVIVATKGGILWKPDGSDIVNSLKADSIRREVEASLKRLRVEVIDLYQIHWPVPDEEIEEGWGAVADLTKSGKIRYGGVSNFTVAQLERVRAIHPVTSLQPPYSLLERGVESALLAHAAANRIGVIVYSPLQAGLLSGKLTKARVDAFPNDDWRRNNAHFQAPALTANLAFVEGLRAIAARHGRPVAQIAVAWTLRRAEVTAAIVGGRSAAQVEEVVGAAELALTAEDIAEIDALLRARERVLAKAA
jgi:aryl-alcohol dehydrogenase-like predicted oxidoreductase